jgi:hypothetical protein
MAPLALVAGSVHDPPLSNRDDLMPNVRQTLRRESLNSRMRARGFALSARARGFIMLQMIAGAAVAAVLVGMLGYTLVSMVKSGSNAQRASDTRDLLRQAAYTLTVAAVNADADDAREPPAGTDYTPGAATESPSATETYPTYPSPSSNKEGWYIPKASAAPKVDAWGSYLKYCVWDNGSANTSTGRKSGDATATYVSAVAFAVISAGADKMMQTTCAQAMAGTPQVDDAVRAMTNSQIVQGVGGTAYLGDAVANAAALGILGAVQPGQMRTDLSTGTVYVNRTGGVGADKWVAVSGGGGSTGNFPFNLINKPTLGLADATTSLSAFSSVLNLSEGGVQYQAYADAALTSVAKDSGTLAANSTFNFRPFLSTGSTYYYVGRRKANINDINGLEVWSAYSDPASSVLAAWMASDGYAARQYATPFLAGSPPAPSKCPAGWVGVPSMNIPNNTSATPASRTTLNIPAFCVMPYPAVQSANGIGGDTAATAGQARTASDTNEWKDVFAWQTTFANAKAVCSSNLKDAAKAPVTGARLMRESEWLAIVHNVIGVPANWSDGAVGMVTPSTNYLVPGKTGLFRASDVFTGDLRRSKSLAAGDILYAIGGDDYQHVYLDSNLNGFTDGSLFNATLAPASIAAPFNSGTRGMGSYGAFGGSGQWNVLRGGSVLVFGAALGSLTNSYLFRCTSTPAP